MQDALEGLTSVRYSSRFVSRFQRENAAEHVHSHVFVSMAAKRYDRNEGAGGARDSRLAGADPGAARDQLRSEHFPAFAGIHARWRHEIPGQSRVGCVLAAPGTPEARGWA